MIVVWHWIVTVTGAANEGGKWYGFWSGFGGSIPDFLILGGIATWYRTHTCHVHHCLRFQRHKVEGTAYVTCRKHHPVHSQGAPTHQDVIDAHEAAQ